MHPYLTFKFRLGDGDKLTLFLGECEVSLAFNGVKYFVMLLCRSGEHVLEFEELVNPVELLVCELTGLNKSGLEQKLVHCLSESENSSNAKSPLESRIGRFFVQCLCHF